MAKIFVHCIAGADGSSNLAATRTTDIGPNRRIFLPAQLLPNAPPDPLHRFREHTDPAELGKALYDAQHDIDLRCPRVQDLITSSRGTFYGELLRELAWPTPSPKKLRLRGPKRRRSALAAPMPSLFDVIAD